MHKLALTKMLAIASVAVALPAAAFTLFPGSSKPESSSRMTGQLVSATADAPSGQDVMPSAAAKEQPAAFARASVAADAVPASLVARDSRYQAADMRRVASVPMGDGSVRSVALIRRDDAKTCVLLLESDGTVAGGCNPTDDPFAGRQLFWTSVYDGGPDPKTRTNFVVAGVARPGVKTVLLEWSDGSETPLPVGTDQAFSFRLPDSQLQAGLQLSGLVAEDASGKASDTVRLAD